MLDWLEHHWHVTLLLMFPTVFVLACVFVVVCSVHDVLRSVVDNYFMGKCKRCKREGRVW